MLNDATSSVMTALMSQDKQSNIKIEITRDKSANKIHSLLQEAEDGDALSFTQVTRRRMNSRVVETHNQISTKPVEIDHKIYLAYNTNRGTHIAKL